MGVGSYLMQLTPDSVIVAAQQQVSCQVDDEAALLNLQTGVYYGLDRMGAYLWSLLREPVTVRALQEHVQHEYDAAADVVATDIGKFLEEMLAAGLIELA
jgi:hypothetical protein